MRTEKKERALAVIKPDAMAKGLYNTILAFLFVSRLEIRNVKRCRLSLAQAATLYYAHADKDYFGDLIEFTSSGEVALIELVGDQCSERLRQVVSQVRELFASRTVLRENAMHGSDSPEAGEREASLFFM